MILRNAVGNLHSPTVVVAAISGKPKKMDMPTHYYLPAGNGLDIPSVVWLEQLRTIDKSRLGGRIGELRSHVQAITLDEVALLEKLKKQMNLDDSEQQNLLRQEAKKLTHRLSELTQITADLYEDKVIGENSEVTFTALMNKNEKERQTRQAQHDEAQNHLSETQAKVLSMTKWAEVIKRHIHLTDLCRADVEELIDHIEIGESDYSSGARQQEIKIYWRFIGCLNT